MTQQMSKADATAQPATAQVKSGHRRGHSPGRNSRSLNSTMATLQAEVSLYTSQISCF